MHHENSSHPISIGPSLKLKVDVWSNVIGPKAIDVGLVVGSALGLFVGSVLGLLVGMVVGLIVGSLLGFIVGLALGLNVGSELGLFVGSVMIGIIACDIVGTEEKKKTEIII